MVRRGLGVKPQPAAEVSLLYTVSVGYRQMSSNWIKEIALEGYGVRLEPMQAEHAQGLEQAVADGELWKLWFTLVPDQGSAQSYIEQALAMEAAGTARPFVIRLQESGRVVGSTRFCHIDDDNQRVEIGYTWLAKSMQRTFVNAACKQLLLTHAFEVRGAIAVEFRTHWHNRASRRAIERLGAKQDGVLRQHRRDPDGSYRDTVVFSILQSEWPAVRRGLLADLSY